MNGNQVLFMDPYLVHYPRESRNLCISPVNAICGEPDPRWDNFRRNLGHILKYSRKLNLATSLHRALCVRQDIVLPKRRRSERKYLVYAPTGGSFTVNLSAMSGSRTLSVEWFNPSTGGRPPQIPFAQDHPPNLSPRHSAETRCST